MSATQTHAQVVERRAELMVELFLQELDPAFVAQPSTDLAFDFFIGFTNPQGGMSLTAVKVKATEQPVNGRFSVQKRLHDRWANSNIPVLILVADVKRNRLFYTWPTPATSSASTTSTVLLELTEIDEHAKQELRDRLAG